VPHSDQRSISAIIKDIDAAFEAHHQEIKKKAQKLYNYLDDFERHFDEERYINPIKSAISGILLKAKEDKKIVDARAYTASKVIGASSDILQPYESYKIVSSFFGNVIPYIEDTFFEKELNKIFDFIIDSPSNIRKKIITNLLNAFKIRSILIEPNYPSLEELCIKSQSHRELQIQQLRKEAPLFPEIVEKIKLFENFSNQAPQHLNAFLKELENNLDSISYQNILQFTLIEPSSDAFHQKSFEIAEKMFATFSQHLTEEKMDDLLKVLDNPKIISLDLSIIEKVILTKLEFIEKPQIEFIVSKLSKYEKKESNEYIEKLVLQLIDNKKYSVNDLINRLNAEKDKSIIKPLLYKIAIQSPQLMGPAEIENLIKEPSEYLYVNSHFDLLILAIDKRNDLINAEVLDALIAKIKKHSGLFGYFNKVIESLFHGLYIILNNRLDLIKEKEEEIIIFAIKDNNNYTFRIFNQLAKNNPNILNMFISMLNSPHYQTRIDAGAVLSYVIETRQDLIKMEQFVFMLQDSKTQLSEEFLKFLRDIIMEHPELIRESTLEYLSLRTEEIALEIYGSITRLKEIEQLNIPILSIKQPELIIQEEESFQKLEIASPNIPLSKLTSDREYRENLDHDLNKSPTKDNLLLANGFHYNYELPDVAPAMKKIMHSLPIFQYCWEEILYFPKIALPKFMQNQLLWLGGYAFVSFAARDLSLTNLASYSARLFMAKTEITGTINSPADFAKKCFMPVAIPTILGIMGGYDGTVNAIASAIQCYQMHNKGDNNQLTMLENIIPYAADAFVLSSVNVKVEDVNLDKFITIAGYLAVTDQSVKLLVNGVKEYIYEYAESAHNYIGECYKILFWVQEA
jgi:hypothetical protein